MIAEFVERWEKNKEAIRAEFATHPEAYSAVVERVVKHLHDPDADYDKPNPDPKKVHAIDDGDYQGTLLFLVPQAEYQPSDYFYVRVSYGSCSGCDTLQDIRGYDDEPPTAEQVEKYMVLALHIVQGLKALPATDEPG